MTGAALASLRDIWSRGRFEVGRRLRRPVEGRFQPYPHTLPDRYPWLFDFARSALQDVPAPRLLSFGCSRGDEVFSLRRRFPQASIKGVDIDPANIDACLATASPLNDDRLSFEVAPNTHAEPSDGYDAIFCLAVLCHGDLTVTRTRRSNPLLRFEDFEKTIADFTRCLKPGGFLFLHTTNFRFCDTDVAGGFETVLEARSKQMAPDVLFDREGRLMPGERYFPVGFRKRATRMTSGAEPLQQRYLRLARAIEDRFEVARWRSDDVDLWPPARMDMFLDMFRAKAGDTAPPAPPFLLRAAASLATPLTNIWKSRHDLDHWIPWPRTADAILLGDGVSLDLTGAAWRDRHGEPVIAALEHQGRPTFLMQPGGLTRLPWARPTFAANTIAARAALTAALGRRTPLDLPDHRAVLDFLRNEGVEAPALGLARLAKRARTIADAASAFQRLLRKVRPRLGFVVTYYAGLGHAFVLACRREGVLSVDLQHCPQEGTHRAYRWSGLPARGYSTLPAAFWTWTQEDAAHIAAWADDVPDRRHAAVHGGHSQLTPFLGDGDSSTREWDQRFAAVGDGASFEREILVALQPIGGKRAVWEALAREIENAPAEWRWWIRRHPSSTRAQDGEYQRLLELRRPNVVIDEASELPLPALFRQMSALVSLASGAAAEAAAFGVPALFLDEEALGSFPGLIERGAAKLINVAEIVSRIASSPPRPSRPTFITPPPITETIGRLDAMADDYRRLCRTDPSG